MGKESVMRKCIIEDLRMKVKKKILNEMIAHGDHTEYFKGTSNVQKHHVKFQARHVLKVFKC